MSYQLQRYFLLMVISIFAGTLCTCFVIAVVLLQAQIHIALVCLAGFATILPGIVLTYILIQRYMRRIWSGVDKIVEFSNAVCNGATSAHIDISTDDLPSMKRAQEAVNRLAAKPMHDLQEMKRLESVRSEFLGNVSHELRTPIFAVQGFLETLLDGALDDEAVRQQFVEKAYSNTLRLNTLLTDLIDISRMESGSMRMSFRYFPIEPLVKEIVHNMESAAKAREITLSVESALKNGTDVFGDRDRLAQVMTNLVDNAIKYNVPHGAVTIVLENVRDGRGEEEVRVKVRDTGIGIAQEHHRRIFERFYRVDKARSRSVGGSGLGLAIVKHILEAHKSVMYVESSPSLGTIMSFTLKR